ncbi:hypothetical protein [Limimaricola soesokkakensis]|uniref:hypothetical protein n=1 Tax=Limimaricola soesokkakensis TaxID=1343159 RepID=UPI003512FBDC
MLKTYRSYEKMCRHEGFDLLGIEAGRKHCRLIFEAGFVTAAVSPSDHRNMLNVRSAIRRLHQ